MASWLTRSLMVTETLHTDRLVLRPFQRDDLDDFFEYSKNPRVGPPAGWKPHADKRESKQILFTMVGKKDTWAIALKGGKVIGSISLYGDNKRANGSAKTMGYVLGEAYWGKGFATEAAQAVLRYAFLFQKVDLVSICHFPTNNRSQRVIEKCGFRYEGTLRKACRLYNNEVHDEVCYSLTREEYLQDAREAKEQQP